MRSHLLAALAASVLGGCAAQPELSGVNLQPIEVVAAGSLRAVLTEIARSYEGRSGQPVVLTFGASGLLRERIERGEAAQVFASADTGNPQKLALVGGWSMPRVFARNQLCALTQAGIHATPQLLLEIMLDPAVRLGTSTPKADPAGDYAWMMFRKAEALRPGAYAALDGKALQLTGAANSPKAPVGHGTYGWIMEEGQADIFLTYCTNALAAQREVPQLKIVALPSALQVGADYGLTVRRDASPSAQAFADMLFEPQAKEVFVRHGFSNP